MGLMRCIPVVYSYFEIKAASEVRLGLVSKTPRTIAAQEHGDMADSDESINKVFEEISAVLIASGGLLKSLELPTSGEVLRHASLPQHGRKVPGQPPVLLPD